MENSLAGIAADRGEVTAAVGPGRPRRVANIADPLALNGYVSSSWNQCHVIAHGGVTIHIMNGQLIAVQICEIPPAIESKSGLIGLEVEMNPARVKFRNLWLKTLD